MTTREDELNFKADVLQLHICSTVLKQSARDKVKQSVISERVAAELERIAYNMSKIEFA